MTHTHITHTSNPHNLRGMLQGGGVSDGSGSPSAMISGMTGAPSIVLWVGAKAGRPVKVSMGGGSSGTYGSREGEEYRARKVPGIWMPRKVRAGGASSFTLRSEDVV